MFGHTTPLDGEAEARRLLTGKRIAEASVDRQTADLTLRFDADTRLDVFNNSSRYERWQARCSVDGVWISVIALGGGDVANF
jgi:hypothetical protein